MSDNKWRVVDTTDFYDQAVTQVYLEGCSAFGTVRPWTKQGEVWKAEYGEGNARYVFSKEAAVEAVKEMMSPPSKD